MPPYVDFRMTHPCVFKSSRSEALPNLADNEVIFAPLQTFTEEELMLKEMGNVSI